MEFAFALYVFVGSNSWENASLMDRVATYTDQHECLIAAIELNKHAIHLGEKVRYTCIKVPKQ